MKLYAELTVLLLAAVMVHELGHLAAAVAFRWQIKGVRLDRRGFGVHVVGRYRRHENVIVALAGIAANCLMGYALGMRHAPILGWLVASVGLIQLLPFPHSDGWRAFRTMQGKW